MALEDATNPMQGVSGPGPFAKRTDLQYQPDQYGGGIAYDANKAAAPLEKATPTPSATNTEVRQAAAQSVGQAPISLFDKTNFPNRDIMHGTDAGPGAGSEALMMNSQFAQAKLSDTLAQMLPYDQTGEIAVLYQQAQARGM